MIYRHRKKSSPRPTAAACRSIAGFSGIALSLALAGCADINSSWEVDGGGYFKYSIDGDGPYTIELSKNDVEPPFYVNNSHHYFYAHSRLEESSRKDQFALMVNAPSTGKKLTPVAMASMNGKMQVVTWMRFQNSSENPLISDSGYVRFDEIINDSLWTCDVDLYFKDCRAGSCKEGLDPIHVTGRLRYWVPDSER